MADPAAVEGVNYQSFGSRTPLMVTKHTPQSPYGEKVVISVSPNSPSIDIPAGQISELIEMLGRARDWNGGA